MSSPPPPILTLLFQWMLNKEHLHPTFECWNKLVGPKPDSKPTAHWIGEISSGSWLVGKIADVLCFFLAFIHSMGALCNHVGRRAMALTAQWVQPKSKGQWKWCVHNLQEIWIFPGSLCNAWWCWSVCLWRNKRSQQRVEAAVQEQDELNLIAGFCSH